MDLVEALRRGYGSATLRAGDNGGSDAVCDKMGTMRVVHSTQMLPRQSLDYWQDNTQTAAPRIPTGLPR